MTRHAIRLLIFAVVCAPLHPGGAFALQSGEVDVAALSREPYLERLLATTTVAPANEVRALWVVRDALRNVQSVDRLVDFAIQARFHLLFVQVRGRGDAYYRSTIEPPAAELEAPLEDFDPLEYLIIRARRAGISVHAWVNVFYVWSDPNRKPPPGHVVTKHPDWLLSSPRGVRQDAHDVRWWQEAGIEGYYLNPANPQVRAYTASVVADLVTHYPLDGVHLDYVRYPGRGFTYGPSERTRFALQWGVDPIDIGAARDQMSNVLGQGAVAALDSAYVRDRAADVDSTVAAIRAVTGSLPLSAAVVADPDQGYLEKGQDWVRWLQRRTIDFAVPMAYALTPMQVEQRVRFYHNLVGRDRVLIGLALYDGRDQYLADTIPLIRHENAIGFSLFSYNVLADNPFSASFIDEVILEPLEQQGTDMEGESPDSTETDGP